MSNISNIIAHSVSQNYKKKYIDKMLDFNINSIKIKLLKSARIYIFPLQKSVLSSIHKKCYITIKNLN